VHSALIPLAFVVGLATGFLFWGRTPVPSAVAAVGEPQAPTRLEVSADDDAALGPADAPITIIEFSDYNCPYCEKWHVETFQPLMAAYPDQIRFVYRDFPITSQESTVAAQAAECAGEQDAYWSFHDSLLSGGLDLGRQAYEQYAARLGLNVERFWRASIRDVRRRGPGGCRYAAAWRQRNPDLLHQRSPLVGAQPLSEFQAVIDSELQG
jgi:hypothetical protein